MRSLRHVVALARLASYTKAADVLGLSQPALSRSIQQIEQRAKVRLFDRDRGGVHPTAVGRAFVERAAALLREADDLDLMLSHAASGAQGDVAFGMAPLPAAALLPDLLAKRLTATPQLRCQVAVRSAEGLLPLLVDGSIEFFVCAEGQIPQAAPVNSVSLGWFPTSLVVRADHPLLAPETAAARRFPLIVAAQAGGLQQGMEDREPYLPGAPHLVLDDYGALAQIAETSDAIWLSSAFAVADQIRAGRLRLLPDPPDAETPRFRMLLYSLDRRSLSPGALRLRDQFRRRIRELSEAFALSSDDQSEFASMESSFAQGL